MTSDEADGRPDHDGDDGGGVGRAGPADQVVGEVRRATVDDVDAVVGVWWRARRASVPAIPPPVHPREEVRAWLAGSIAGAGGAEAWVAVAGAPDQPDRPGPVALLVLVDDELDQLYVDPAWTSRGNGGRLIDLAKQRRPAGLHLWTFQANVRARAFYRRHGFVEGRTTTGDNEEHAPDVRLSWRPPRPS